jgi:hypothetical protein
MRVIRARVAGLVIDILERSIWSSAWRAGALLQSCLAAAGTARRRGAERRDPGAVGSMLTRSPPPDGRPGASPAAAAAA